MVVRSTPCSASPATPTSPWRRKRPTTCWRGRDGAAPPPLRARGAPRGAGGHQRRDARAAGARARPRDGRRHRAPRTMLDLTCLFQLHSLDRPTEGHAVAAGHRRAHPARRGTPTQHLLGHPRAGADGAPPVRELRQQRREFIAQAADDPRVQSHQDDALPRGRRQPDRAQPDARRRARRAGGGARRAEGALRRGHQRRLGPRAGARRRARGVRPGRPEDARQDHAGGAPRRRRPAPLLPHRHRQLQLEDGAPVRRRRLPHLRPDVGATSPSCSTTSPATAGRSSSSRCWWRRATCATSWST
jgi:hypothetical protein